MIVEFGLSSRSGESVKSEEPELTIEEKFFTVKDLDRSKIVPSYVNESMMIKEVLKITKAIENFKKEIVEEFQ